MDITSNSTPMFSNENENNNNRNKDNKGSNSKSNDSKSNNSKEERQLTDQDYELQALMFYYLKKRIEHNNSFNPTINIVTSKSKHNEKDLQRNEEQKQKSNDEQKKEVDAVKDFILKQHASEERKKKKKDVDNDVDNDKKNKKNTNKSKDVTKALSEENKIFVTEISAFDPIDSALKTWSGPNIIAKSEEEADFLIQNTGLGYCKVIGELAGLIDTDGNDVKNAYRDN